MNRFGSLFSDGAATPGGVPGPGKTVPYHLLLVDDEENIVNALRRVFRNENYQIHSVASGAAALALLERQPCQLMIADFMMPTMNGVELLRQVRDKYPGVMRIMLTGQANTEAVMGAIKDGAVYKFILKPWNDDDLRVSVALALEQHDLLRKNRALRQQNDSKSREIKALSKLTVTNRSQLAILLHRKGLLNQQQVQQIYTQQQQRKEPVIQLILKSGWVSEQQIREVLKKDLLIEEVNLAEMNIEPVVTALLPRSFCDKQLVLPLRLEQRRLVLVMADPMDLGLIDDLKFSAGMEIQPVMANIRDIKEKIAAIHGETLSFEDLETVLGGDDPADGIEIVIEDDDDIGLEELLHGTEEPPAIRLANVIMLEAVRLGASDIHIHPRTKSVVVRYRIDGVLQDKIQFPHNIHLALVSRIKVMAELDLTERRRPQDGRITVKTPLRIIDLRISTLPTINGEKVVMRLLDRNASVQKISDLGLSAENIIKVENVVSKPQGIILATGPTGSGKTTTLYSMLQHNATPERNYVTIEDPVEYYLDMAGQVMIKEKIGLDFSTVLRAILRQDPDVILLGEIRDFETAEVAFHAALTGHLVYSTLHTNSSIATIARLLDLGLKPYVLASAIEAIIAQRLARKICSSCRRPVAIAAELRHKLGEHFQAPEIKFYKGEGCPRCNKSGYAGRVALYEILIPSAEMKELIASGAGFIEIAKLAQQQGITSLIEDARDKVNAGLTTVEEVLRVLGPQVVM
ncbi:MAG: Flp pilus assembly complex ATPase component TadA [Gammaproteobacteria bacterium]|nr:Flp pilus assembly complex ATPase component TadA [Gammaproteobacteria bacterium]